MSLLSLRILLGRERISSRKSIRSVKGSSRKSATKDEGSSSRSSSRKQLAAARAEVRSTARSTARSSRCSVDRRAQRAQGWSSVDRPVDRLKVPNSLLGTRSTNRSTGGRGRSTARSTDKRVRAVIAILETCWYKYGISRVFMNVGKSGALLRSEVLLVL